jgi:hypothetical protein
MLQEWHLKWQDFATNVEIHIQCPISDSVVNVVSKGCIAKNIIMIIKSTL